MVNLLKQNKFRLENNSVKEYFLLLIFLGCCYFSFFLRLSAYPLLMWDESREAVSAFELLQNKNFIVTTYGGIPDLWNTKPPLMIWTIAAFMKVFGYSELAIRLPSALAATITSIAVFNFVKKQTGKVFFAFCSGMVLITSIGFIGAHVARSADTDALTVMFLTLFVLKFYDFLNQQKDKQSLSFKKLYYSAIYFSLALLTKSAYGLLLLPGILALICIFDKSYIFKSPHIYIAFLLSFSPCIVYYIIRENQNPGYLNAVWKNDFSGRYLDTIENHSEPFWFYFISLLKYQFFPWFYVLSLSFFLFRKGQEKEVKKLIIMALTISFSFLMLISFSRTKISYYDAAFFPFAAIVAGLVISQFTEYMVSVTTIKNFSIKLLLYLILFLGIFFYPSRIVLSYANITPAEAHAYQLKYGPFMDKIYSQNFHVPIKYFDTEYNSHLLFYIKLYTLKGENHSFISSIDCVEAGDLIATCTPKLKDQILQTYSVSLIQEDNFCSCYKILSSH